MATTSRTFTSPQVILFSEDVERASAFYRRLGFEETFRVPEEGSPIHVDLSLDGYTIGFASMAWLDRLLIAWVQDPDGHPIQLVQELTDRHPGGV
ncbi:MAG: VOC family protein [Solirubrobacteraceae bacterium]